MTIEDRERLRSYTDRVVSIITADGEKMVAKIILMQDEYDDVICDIISSNREEKYKKPLSSSAYTIQYDDITYFELSTDTENNTQPTSANGAPHTSLGRSPR